MRERIAFTVLHAKISNGSARIATNQGSNNVAC